MPLTMKTFGKLTAAVARMMDHAIDASEIEWLHDIASNIAAVEPPKADLVPLFSAMIESKKIEAIKEYRTLTGCSLIDSKNEVERIMGKFVGATS